MQCNLRRNRLSSLNKQDRDGFMCVWAEPDETIANDLPRQERSPLAVFAVLVDRIPLLRQSLFPSLLHSGDGPFFRDLQPDLGNRLLSCGDLLLAPLPHVESSRSHTQDNLSVAPCRTASSIHACNPYT